MGKKHLIFLFRIILEILLVVTFIHGKVTLGEILKSLFSCLCMCHVLWKLLVKETNLLVSMLVCCRYLVLARVLMVLLSRVVESLKYCIIFLKKLYVCIIHSYTYI
jgi:hypothetical protein